MPFASAATIRASLQKPSTILVDVRTSIEIWFSGKIQVGNHRWYQASSITSLPTHEWNKDKTDIIVYCASGSRSTDAKRALEAQGFRTVLNGGGYADMKQKVAGL